jgi:hypothetical protein
LMDILAEKTSRRIQPGGHGEDQRLRKDSG